MNRHNIGRRDFLKLAATAATGLGLAACAPQVTTAPGPTGVSEATNPPAAVSTAAPSAGLVTLRVHHRVGGECDNWTGLATKFNEQNPGIKVVPECFPGADYFQKLNTLAAGGTLGDVFWISSSEGFYRMAGSGVMAPLDGLVSASKFDLSQIYSRCVEAARLKGKLYGLPQLAHPGDLGLYYNKPVFDAAKVDYPKDTWTYDDLLATAQKLTESKNGVWGYMDTDQGYFQVKIYTLAWGGDAINNDGTKCLLDSAESIAGLQYCSDLYNKYHVAPKPVAGTLGPQQLFPSNKLAMYSRGF
ncbi:MAG: extracellular solute-binding protein, partial [Candidatus Marsarchaeota archaeon]|nr:extracellular solute-binding protein [Candidatus Marsarchaeota archaeon]